MDGKYVVYQDYVLVARYEINRLHEMPCNCSREVTTNVINLRHTMRDRTQMDFLSPF